VNEAGEVLAQIMRERHPGTVWEQTAEQTAEARERVVADPLGGITAEQLRAFRARAASALNGVLAGLDGDLGKIRVVDGDDPDTTRHG
jgi:hypothetical protein